MNTLYTEHDLPELLLTQLQAPKVKRHQQSATQGMLEEGSYQGSDQEDEPFFDSVSLAEAIELYSIVRELKPDQSAEIGFCSGGSTLAILQAIEANHKGHHYVCDPYQLTYAKNRGIRNVHATALAKHFTFFESFPENIFPDLPELQLAFVDASHLFDLSILDFILVDKRLSVGGVIGFHDLWMPSLQKLVRFILKNRHYEIYRLPTWQAPSRSTKTQLKCLIGSLLSALPAKDKLFAPELLDPWERFELGNMCFLRKTSSDQRDWRHFNLF